MERKRRREVNNIHESLNNPEYDDELLAIITQQ
jgi:hypothetical protein